LSERIPVLSTVIPPVLSTAIVPVLSTRGSPGSQVPDVKEAYIPF
jgi:hypothetical protein